MTLPHEPEGTAMVLAIVGLLLGASALASRASGRFGVPISLAFLLIGMLAGSEGLGGIQFDNYELTFRLGSTALALIIFDGGLNTAMSSVRKAFGPALTLATVGVVITAGLTMLAGRIFGLSWPMAALVGAVVSSTDAAAVFSSLRGSGLRLHERVAATLEIEAGVNDPVAVILTLSVTQSLVAHQTVGWTALRDIFIQLLVGAAVGLGVGRIGKFILNRVRLEAGGLYPTLSLATALISFGAATLLSGSGFLAVYLTALTLGQGAIRYRAGLLRVHDSLAWFSQIAMFLVLGLLVFPSQLVHVAPLGIGLGLVLALVARPTAVGLCLLPFRYSWKENLYVGWVGLRGAVPIILATFPVLEHVPEGHEVFNIVFFLVLVNAFVPGTTVRIATKYLGMAAPGPPPPPAAIEITSTGLLEGDVSSFYIGKASAVCGASLSEIPFPPGTNVMLIMRGQQMVAPKGNTVLEAGDHVYVFSQIPDKPLLLLLFGAETE